MYLPQIISPTHKYYIEAKKSFLLKAWKEYPFLWASTAANIGHYGTGPSVCNRPGYCPNKQFSH